MKICGRNPKIFSRVRQFHRRTDNKGSAMVVVIIAMAFIGILASVLMYMSLLNYQMKVNNLKAKDNFYSAETVLDEVRTAMGERVSASVGSAYELVLKNYEATSAEEKQNKLRYYFLKDMQDYYAVTGSVNINNYDLTKLFNSLSSEIKRGTVLETLNDSGEVVYRMALDSSGSLKVYVMTTDPVTGNKERVETTDIPTGRFQLYTDGLSFCGLNASCTASRSFAAAEIEIDSFPAFGAGQLLASFAADGVSHAASPPISQIRAPYGSRARRHLLDSFARYSADHAPDDTQTLFISASFAGSGIFTEFQPFCKSARTEISDFFASKSSKEALNCAPCGDSAKALSAISAESGPTLFLSILILSDMRARSSPASFPSASGAFSPTAALYLSTFICMAPFFSPAAAIFRKIFFAGKSF